MCACAKHASVTTHSVSGHFPKEIKLNRNMPPTLKETLICTPTRTCK